MIPPMRIPLPLLALFALALAGAHSAAAAEVDEKRFLAAYGELQRGRVAAAVEHAEGLPQNSPERAYLDYRIAVRELESGNDSRAGKIYDRTLSDYVRRGLALQLASHYSRENDRTSYDRIRTVFRDDDSPGFRCADGVFDPAGREAIRDLWYAVDLREYKACDHLFKQAVRRGDIDQEDIWRKLRRYAGQRSLRMAQRVLTLLPRSSRPTAKQLASAIRHAAKRIKGKHNLDTRARKEMVAVSAMVAARSNPSLVERRWNKFSQYFSQSTNDDVWLAVAVWSAKFHRGNALDLFRKVDLGLYDDEARAWRVRAALRAADWKDVVRTTDAMPQEQADVTAWRYWRAHALLQTGQDTEGKRMMDTLAEDEDDFYGLVARERLELPLIRGRADNGAVPDPRSFEDIDFDLALAWAAHRTGNPWQGLRIWKSALDRLSPEDRVAASAIAHGREWYLASTVASDAVPPAQSSLDLRFPTPYMDITGEYTRELNLDLAFVYGLMRQESRFMLNAVSYANAQGLMQVLPATAKKVARKNRFTKYKRSRLKRPDTNIIIGTHYLDELRSSLGSDPILIAAGYNAGARPAQTLEGEESGR